MDKKSDTPTKIGTQEEHDKLARLIKFAGYDPQNASLLSDALTLALDLQEWSCAEGLEELCQPLLESAPSLSAKLGYLKLCTNQPTAAANYLSHAIESGIDDPTVRYNLAYSLLVNKETQSALEQLSSLTEHPEATAEHFILYARCYLQQEDIPAAITPLETMHNKMLPTAESAGLLALCMFEEDLDTDVVKAWADKAIELDPQNLEGLLTQASLCVDADNFDQASTIYQQTLDAHPRSGRAWSGLAQVQFHNFEFDAAEESLNNAVEYLDTHIGTWHLLGWCHIMKGNIEAALDAFEQSYKIDRSFGETHAGLASVYALKNNTKMAEKHLRLAEKLDPNAFGITFTQMLLLSNDNKNVEAMQVFEKAKKTVHPQLGRAPADLIDKRIAEITAELEQEQEQTHSTKH